MSRVSDAFQPAQLVFAHSPQTHTGQHISRQQRMVCGGWQGHVQGLQLVSNMHSGVDTAQLLLAVCLQSCTCLQQQHSAVTAGVSLGAAGCIGGGGRPLTLAILKFCYANWSQR